MLFKKYLSLALVAVTASTFTLPTNIVFANDNITVQSNVVKKRVFSVSSNGELILITNNTQTRVASNERIVIASYELSAEQIQTLADNMKFYQNNWFGFGEFLVKLINPVTAVAAYCHSLARNAIFRQDVVDAAKNGDRMRIIITDYKDYHTSYSVQVEYEVIH